MSLNDELLKLVNSQERVYLYFYDTQELIGVPTINSTSNRLIYKPFAKSAFSFSPNNNVAYFLVQDNNGRLVLVENAFNFTETKDGSVPLNIRTVDFYTADEMNKLREGIESYQHNLFNSIKKVAFLNDKLRPIPEFSNLYVIDSSILMTYMKGNNFTKSIVYPFDNSSAYNGLSAFLALFQVESEQYQRGLGKQIMKISERVISDYFNEKGEKSVLYGGKLVPLDFCMRFNFKQGESYDFAVTDEYGKVHKFNGKNSSAYYILCQIYSKLGFKIQVVPESSKFFSSDKQDMITLISKEIKTEPSLNDSTDGLNKKWIRPDLSLPDKLNNFELIY